MVKPVGAAATFRRLAVLVSLAFLTTVALTADRFPSASAAGTSPSVGALRICPNCAATGGDLSRYRYVVLQAWEYGRIPTLRPSNRNLKILAYKDLPPTVSYACHTGL